MRKHLPYILAQHLKGLMTHSPDLNLVSNLRSFEACELVTTSNDNDDDDDDDGGDNDDDDDGDNGAICIQVLTCSSGQPVTTDRSQPHHDYPLAQLPNTTTTTVYYCLLLAWLSWPETRVGAGILPTCSP